ncbi:MAG: helix-turn-helix domain-containing protein [Pseudonocardiaceae bacterium]
MNAEDAEHARTVGMRLWRLRDDRGKSLRVVAELAGMSTATLWRIEQGKRALASQGEVVALANALQIAPDELTRLPVPAPANGHTDSTIAAVDRALMAVSHDLPDGQVLPMEALRSRSRRRWTRCAAATRNGRSAPRCPA